MKTLGIAIVLALATQSMGCGSSDSPSQVTASRFALVANHGSDNVSVYAIDPTTGALAPVAGSPFSAGRLPRCVAVTPSGSFAYVANAGIDTQPGGVSIFAVNPTSGALTPVGGSLMAAGERPWVVAVHTSGRFVYVASGLDSSPRNGDLRAFAVDRATGALTPAGSPFSLGKAPYSVAVHPSGMFAYVLSNGEVSTYSINSTTGALSQIGGSPVQSGSGSDTASLAIHPSGAYAYVANEFDGSISMFSVDKTTGALSHLAGSPLPAGTFPNSVAIHPSGDFALVSDFWDNDVQVYSINRSTGALAAVTSSNLGGAYYPHWLAVSSTGAFAYVANYPRLGSGNVSAYTVDGATGSLTPVSGSPFGSPLAAEAEPDSIALAP